MKRLLTTRLLLVVVLSLVATLSLAASAYAGQIDLVLSAHSVNAKLK